MSFLPGTVALAYFFNDHQDAVQGLRQQQIEQLARADSSGKGAPGQVAKPMDASSAPGSDERDSAEGSATRAGSAGVVAGQSADESALEYSDDGEARLASDVGLADDIALFEEEGVARWEASVTNVPGQPARHAAGSAGVASASSSGEPSAYPYEEDGKWGFQDAAGQKLTPPSLDHAWEYDGEASLVEKDGRYGFVDDTGKVIAPPVYEEAFGYSDGLADVKVDGKYGFIDKKGETVVPPQFDYAWPFLDGLALVKKDGKYGYIDTQGQYVVEPRLDETFTFSEALSVISVNGKYGFIDKTGKQVIPPQYDYAWPFSGGQALVEAAGRHFYIDKTGKFLRAHE